MERNMVVEDYHFITPATLLIPKFHMPFCVHQAVICFPMQQKIVCFKKEYLDY